MDTRRSRRRRERRDPSPRIPTWSDPPPRKPAAERRVARYVTRKDVETLVEGVRRAEGCLVKRRATFDKVHEGCCGGGVPWALVHAHVDPRRKIQDAAESPRRRLGVAAIPSPSRLIADRTLERTRRHGISAASPRRRASAKKPAASLRRRRNSSTEYPRRRRGVAATHPRNIHGTAAASPRLIHGASLRPARRAG